MAIESVRHKGIRELFVDGRTRRIDKRQQKKIIELLDILDAAMAAKDLTGVSDFHPLKGNRRGEYAVHVTGNWCLTFRFMDGQVLDLDYEDYH